MSIEKWISKNTHSLKGKTIAISGTTGGLGKELCRYMASLGASLILVDRNAQKSQSFCDELKNKYGISVRCITADMEDIASVKRATEELKQTELDVFIHNAGAYDIPRHKCSTGYDNVYQINFVSPYYIIKEIIPLLRQRKGRVIAVGSIAHNYSEADKNDVDFSLRKQASKTYGNAKRYLMFSLMSLFERETHVKLSITHPGISFTGITNHYPKVIFFIIKNPMKVIFMKPKKACLSILSGLFEETNMNEWIGPKFFNVWGLPKKQILNTASKDEINFISQTAERIYNEIK